MLWQHSQNSGPDIFGERLVQCGEIVASILGQMTQCRLESVQTGMSCFVAGATDRSTVSAMRRFNRLTSKKLPGSGADVTYAYDIIGRTTSVLPAARSSVSPRMDWVETSPRAGRFGSRGFQYDMGGTGPASSIPVQRSMSLRPSGGRRGRKNPRKWRNDTVGQWASVTLGNDTVQSYVYDEALLALAQNLGGAAQELTQSGQPDHLTSLNCRGDIP